MVWSYGARWPIGGQGGRVAPRVLRVCGHIPYLWHDLWAYVELIADLVISWVVLRCVRVLRCGCARAGG